MPCQITSGLEFYLHKAAARAVSRPRLTAKLKRRNDEKEQNVVSKTWGRDTELLSDSLSDRNERAERATTTFAEVEEYKDLLGLGWIRIVTT